MNDLTASTRAFVRQPTDVSANVVISWPEARFWVLLAISMSYWHQRRYDESVEWANRALAINLAHMLAREHLSAANWIKGHYDCQISLEHAATYGAPIEILDELQRLYLEGGRTAVVRYCIEHASKAHLQVAILYGEAGETGNAISHLASVLDGRDPCVDYLAVAPQWDSLRPDAGFEACLTRMGLTSRHRRLA